MRLEHLLISIFFHFQAFPFRVFVFVLGDLDLPFGAFLSPFRSFAQALDALVILVAFGS